MPGKWMVWLTFALAIVAIALSAWALLAVAYDDDNNTVVVVVVVSMDKTSIQAPSRRPTLVLVSSKGWLPSWVLWRRR